MGEAYVVAQRAVKKGNYEVKNVPMEDVVTSQDFVETSNLEAIKERGLGADDFDANPIVFKRPDSKYQIIDGNHRAVLQKLAGESDLRVNLIDFNKTDLRERMEVFGNVEEELAAFNVRGKKSR